jgi:type II secretory ATPase GspE/PulE/Tfp pilus assembly ATPase PilB-like protein
MKRLIQSRTGTVDMLNLARKEDMLTLVQDGIHKVLRGETTYQQVRAVAMK